YPREGWGIQRPLLRNLLLADEFREKGISSAADLGLPADFPGLDFTTLDSAMFSDAVRACVWSFSLEPQISVYRHRATGLIMPMSIGGLDRHNMTALGFERANKKGKIKRNHFESFAALFQFAGCFNRNVFG